MNSYKNIEGGKNDILIYSEENLSVLDDSKLNIDINTSIYTDEKHIINYITDVFNNLTNVLDNSKYLISIAKDYIDNSVTNIPKSIKLPELLDNNFDINNTLYTSGTDVIINLKDKNSQLVLREDKNSNSSMIGSLKHNEKITILEDKSSDSNWIKVKTLDGTSGYINIDYIKVEK